MYGQKNVEREVLYRGGGQRKGARLQMACRVKLARVTWDCSRLLAACFKVHLQH